MYSSSVPPAVVSPHSLPDLLLVDATDATSPYATALGEKFRVTQASTTDGALREIARTPPELIVADLSLPDGGGTRVCRAAKGLKVPATVLVTTAVVEQVPGAIAAGCDAVLLKPFAPNLLFARLGRLLRSRSAELRDRAGRDTANDQPHSDLLLAGSNQHWPSTPCPHCAHMGVTSFEFTSYRRAWYACLACESVWVAKRQELVAPNRHSTI
jgi:DNA-binding response OmpR family regulator